MSGTWCGGVIEHADQRSTGRRLAQNIFLLTLESRLSVWQRGEVVSVREAASRQSHRLGERRVPGRLSAYSWVSTWPAHLSGSSPPSGTIAVKEPEGAARAPASEGWSTFCALTEPASL
jgi:hypothetical protein